MTTRGVWASAVLGLTAGAISWGLSPQFTGLTTHAGASRLDQATMWLFGSLVGTAVFGGRARRAGTVPLAELITGAALGGTAALVATTMVEFVPPVSSSATFVVLRAVAWAWCGLLTSAALGSVLPRRVKARLIETAVIGSAGGLIAGLIVALPGPAELWQAIAFVVLGAAIGVAVEWPAARRAVAMVDRTPRHGPVPGVVTLYESPLYDGGAVALGDATLACRNGQLALYPPKSGVVFNGRAVIVPVFLPGGGTLMVGSQRFRIQLIQPHQ
jgi:hypothetical protein